MGCRVATREHDAVGSITQDGGGIRVLDRKMVWDVSFQTQTMVQGSERSGVIGSLMGFRVSKREIDAEGSPQCS